jgi:DNA-binding response OmpR family regulator
MPRLCLLLSLDHEPGAALREGIAGAGFKACPVRSLAEAEVALRQWSCDVMVLAREASQASDRAIRYLRTCGPAPIVVVAAHIEEEAQLRELDAGAAAVIAGPESPRLIGARIRQLLAATAFERPPARVAVQVGSLYIDPDRMRATVAQLPLELTASQFEVLRVLAAHAGDVVTRETLIRVLSACANPGQRSADTHVYWIRRKLDAAGALDLSVETIHGRGYCLSRAALGEPRFDASGGPARRDPADPAATPLAAEPPPAAFASGRRQAPGVRPGRFRKARSTSSSMAA